MKGFILTVLLATTALAGPAHAQFGGGVVLDPTQSAHAAQQLIQGSQLYTTTIKTTQNVMETYNLAQRMATVPSSYYTAFPTWHNRRGRRLLTPQTLMAIRFLGQMRQRPATALRLRTRTRVSNEPARYRDMAH
jgi:hypothetical protein